MSKVNWLDEEVAFYDFVWAYGTGACSDCLNRELFDDFAAGGDKFEQMKKKILEKWPTKTAALSAFEGYKLQENSNGTGSRPVPEAKMKRCKDCEWYDPYIERDTTEYDASYGWCEKKKKDVGIIGEYECSFWRQK